MCIVGETEFLNGVFLSILDCDIEDSEKWSDAALSFSLGLTSKVDW